MIVGFEYGGDVVIWITLMCIGALLWEINKKITLLKEMAK